MKTILISIKPEWVAKILNGEKTIEIRKVMPKCDFPIDVYIYCTKDKKSKVFGFADRYPVEFITSDRHRDTGLNGYVVAKFTLNKVEKISKFHVSYKDCNLYRTSKIDFGDFNKKSCLSNEELDDYFKGKNHLVGYAWHIDNLVIFDRPKELSEFRANCRGCKRYKSFICVCKNCKHHLTKAPQNLCYIEVE